MKQSGVLGFLMRMPVWAVWIVLSHAGCQGDTTVVRDLPGGGTDYRDGVVCPINPAGVPQATGVTVTAIGDVCVEIDGRTTCGLRRNLDEINSPQSGCLAFQDGEQESVQLNVNGPCFTEYTVPSANLLEKNPYDIPLVLDPSVQCWEAENLLYYPVCSQYLAGNDPLVVAVDACCAACGNLTVCCLNCKTDILPPGADYDLLRLGEPGAFADCCADYGIVVHQPDRACAAWE